MKSKTIQTRISTNKKLLLEQLETVPIVQVACEKTGIGRSTYYRWRQQDKDFARRADETILSGKLFINDMAESQLISQIKDKNMTAIIFWLKYNHPSYGNRLEVTHLSGESSELSPEEIKAVEEALQKGSLLNSSNINHEKTESNKTNSKK